MGRRYVPKTYKNRRVLRFIFGSITFVALAAVILFLILFFALQNYVVHYPDGTVRLEHPWIMDDSASSD